MGANNYLTVENAPGRQEPITLWFKYAVTREIQYRIGDVVQWGTDRPTQIDPVVWVGAHNVDSYDPLTFSHFKIKVVDDVLTAIEAISEEEYERLTDEVFDLMLRTGHFKNFTLT